MEKEVPSCEHKDRKIRAKGLCNSCYYKSFMKAHPEKHSKSLNKKRELYKTKKKINPDYFNKKSRDWMKNKMEKDPDWNAKRQRKYRAKHPDKYNYLMARCYMRKLTPEKRTELVKELSNGKK